MVISQSQLEIPMHDCTRDLPGPNIENSARWKNLIGQFVVRFGRKPDYIARAPGRINIIGEHIDYALFGVLPVAIERDVLIACASQSGDVNQNLPQIPGSVVLENLCPRYMRQEFSPDIKVEPVTAISEGHHNDGNLEGHTKRWHLDIEKKQLRWDSYVKAAYYGILEHHFTPTTDFSSSTNAAYPVPVNLLVSGSVPTGSGLSSSAALVVASTLAFLAVNDKLNKEAVDDHEGMTKEKLVLMAMENERRVGVNSGGMDQAASIMSRAYSALYISFYPALDVESISLPSGAILVCANSLVVSDKVVLASSRYNLRVLETLVAARVLARNLGVRIDKMNGRKEKVTLREVVGRYAGERHELDGNALHEALEAVLRRLDVLKPKRRDGKLGVTMEEMITWSGLGEKEFAEVYLSDTEVKASHFQLYKRAKHVLTEALRVLQFRRLCLDAVAELPCKETVARSMVTRTNTLFQEMGRLMNESHESCVYQFECSCSELDELTRLAREAGAWGSRLTGAGWGGCTVSLVAEDRVDTFISKISSTYPSYRNLGSETLRKLIFASRPSDGACVYKLTS